MALKSALSNGDSSMSLCQINNYIGIILGRLKESEKAIAYYQDALNIAENHNDNDAVLQVMANIVDSYIELKKPDEALAFMRTLPKKYLEAKLDESYIYNHLSYLIIYGELKKYAAAQSYSDQIRQLIKVHRPSESEELSCCLLSWDCSTGNTVINNRPIRLLPIKTSSYNIF